MTRSNPAVLKWAREKAGLTEEEAARMIRISAKKGLTPVERLARMEAGREVPSTATLKAMSRQYLTSMAVLGLPQPPPPENLGEDFRCLPEECTVREKALADAALRDIWIRQSIVRDLLEEGEEGKRLIFVGSASLDELPSDLAVRIANSMDFDIQRYREGDQNSAFRYLRDCVEATGVFVVLVDYLGSHKNKIPVKALRGFALADSIAPFIAVNANDSKGAQVFTLLHELVHIWLGRTGISNNQIACKIERFCNDVARSMLLTESELENISVPPNVKWEHLVSIVQSHAAACNVSATMLSYNLHRIGIIDELAYHNLAQYFSDWFVEMKRREREKGRTAKGGPNYYTVRRHRAGPALVSLVDRMLGEGEITYTKAGLVLGVGGANVAGVVDAGRIK